MNSDAKRSSYGASRAFECRTPRPELAALTGLPLLADTCRRPLERATAGAARPLDLALAAHARDHGYRVERWREGAATTTATVAAFLDRDPDDERSSASLLRV